MTCQKDDETVETKSEIINQTLSEQAQIEAPSDPQPDTEEAEVPAVSAEIGQAEARPAENEVSEVEIPNVGKILVLSDADGYNEEVIALSNYKKNYLHLNDVKMTYIRKSTLNGLTWTGFLHDSQTTTRFPILLPIRFSLDLYLT